MKVHSRHRLRRLVPGFVAVLGCASVGRLHTSLEGDLPFAQAYRAFIAHDYTTAAARFDECLGVDPSKVEYEAFLLKAVCLHRMGDTEAGRALLQQGIARVSADSVHFLANALPELQEWSVRFPRVPKVLLPRGGFTLEDVGPSPIKRAEPEYPETALRAGIEGRVMVRALVDERGLATNCTIWESAGEALDLSALRALQLWRFAPGTHHGRRAKFWVVVPFTFRLRGGSEVREVEAASASAPTVRARRTASEQLQLAESLKPMGISQYRLATEIGVLALRIGGIIAADALSATLKKNEWSKVPCNPAR